jgi:hypothetical protein
MASETPNSERMRPFINLVTLMVAGGVVTALLLIPVLLITDNSPILGPYWVGAAAAVGGVFGVWTLMQSASRRWQRIIAGLAVVLGGATLLSVLGIIFDFNPIVEGLLAATAVVFGTVALVLLVKDWTRIGVILAAFFFAGFAVFSIAGSLWAWLMESGTNALTWVFDTNRVDPNLVVQCYGVDGRGCGIVHSLLFSLIFFFIVLTGFAYTTLLERKFIAWFQQRSGPNRVGPYGLLQPAADGVKLILHSAERRGCVGLPYRADPENRPGADRAGGYPARSEYAHPLVRRLLVQRAARSHRSERGCAVAAGDHQHRHIWRHAGRLGEQQQIRDDRRLAGDGADAQLRVEPRLDDGSADFDRRQHEPGRHHSQPDVYPPVVHLPEPAFRRDPVHRAAGGS